jgi:adenylate cyclase
MGRMAPPPPPSDPRNEAFWRDFLTHGDSMESIGRRVFKHIPSDPRCKLCAAPFRGPGAPLMRLIGKAPSETNPKMCTSCFTFLRAHHGGAEIEGTMLFADIRGSTTLAETMSPGDFHDLLDRFYTVASQAVFDHDGTVDKFVGDELVSLFFPLIAGERHAERAVSGARAVLRATGHADPAGPWVPVGAGVHTGTAWFGAVGSGDHVELTAVGDAVNVAARLASVAGAGEIVVSADAAQAAHLPDDLPRTALELKGKQESIEVVRLLMQPGRASRSDQR